MAATVEKSGGNGFVGRRLRRKEDPRLITGRGTYVDDIVLPGTLCAAVVSIDVIFAWASEERTSAACSMPGSTMSST